MDSNGKAQECFQRVFDSRINSGSRSLSLQRPGPGELPIKNLIGWHELHESSRSLLTFIGHLLPPFVNGVSKWVDRPQNIACHLHQRWGRFCSLVSPKDLCGDGMMSCALHGAPTPPYWPSCLPLWDACCPGRHSPSLPPSGLGCVIEFLLLCILSAVCWVSDVCPVQSKRKDLGILSSGKCLMLRRSMYFI